MHTNKFLTFNGYLLARVNNSSPTENKSNYCMRKNVGHQRSPKRYNFDMHLLTTFEKTVPLMTSPGAQLCIHGTEKLNCNSSCLTIAMVLR